MKPSTVKPSSSASTKGVSSRSGLILQTALLSLIAVSSALYISEPIRLMPRDQKIVYKLLPMFFIMLYALIFGRPKSKGDWLLFVGLMVCTLGDFSIAYVFVYGLGSFLVGHLFYIASFACSFAGFKNNMVGISTGLLLFVPYGLWIGEVMWSSVVRKGEHGLVVPVIAYVAAINAMCITAFATKNYFAVVGSVLFLCSDTVLAWNLFVNPVAHVEQIVMTTYYASQICIALSLQSRSRSTGSSSSTRVKKN